MTGRRVGLSSFSLKRVAMALMLLDHVGVALHGMIPHAAYVSLRALGRPAFPLFCFLLVEGFRHTRSRVRYALYLALFAALSELPADLLFRGWEARGAGMNALVTLLLGLLTLVALDAVLRALAQRRLLAGLCCAAVTGAAMALAWLLQPSYGWLGVVLIVWIFLAGRRFPQHRTAAVCAAVALWAAGDTFLDGGIEYLGALACVPVTLYDGSRGESALPKWVFYAFYPAHLAALYLLRCLL